MPASTSTSRPPVWRSPLLLSLALLAGLSPLLALYHYFTGDDATLPVQTVAQLKPVPTVLTNVRIGLAQLPVRVNGYLLTQTHDMVGPYVQVEAAYGLLALLASALVYYLAVVSTLARPAFVAGMAAFIFLLMSLNADLLGIFNSREQYFLILTLAGLGLPAYALHAFFAHVPLGRRLLLFAALIAGLCALLFYRSELPTDATALHLSSFATLGGAVVVALLVLWVAIENIQGLLWFNTQAENPDSRFGLLPFVATSLLYLGTLGLYLLNDGDLLILPGVHLDPLVLLLPAILIGWLSLRRRQASYGEWLSFWPGAAPLYLVFVTLGSAFLGYALATANDPLLLAARHFTALTLFTVGLAFLVYVLVNFAPLIRKRLRVYQVVYEPRRLPLYAVYVLGIGGLVAVEFRNNFETLRQVQAGYYNNLGDLTRLQSELEPNKDALALLAERYYAESDILDEHNHKASLGRAALYRFRLQRQNEINILRRALSRRPSEKISLRLAALYAEPTDFFDRLAVLREGLHNSPTSPRLNNDLALLYTRSALTDSVTWYFNRAEAAAPNSAVVQSNRLAFLLQNEQLNEAQKLVQTGKEKSDAAWQSNALLLAQLLPTQQLATPIPAPDTAASLSVPEFARFYHAALQRVAAHDTGYSAALTYLARQPENSAYFEQLTFLKALTQHYGGQSVPAQNTLLPLATGNTLSAAYYQNLLGLWMLPQQAYSSASARLAESARNGYPEAHLNRAYALALNNQPDSAKRELALVGRLDTSLRRPAQELQQVLALSFGPTFAAAAEQAKAQFLVLRGQTLPAESLVPEATKIQDPAARQVALLAQLPRAVRAGQLAAVRQALAQFAPDAKQNTPVSSAWNVVRGLYYVAAKETNPLRQLAATGYFLPEDKPHQLYFRAVVAAQSKQTQEAGRLYAQLLREAPFMEDGVLAAADFYAQQRDYAAGYTALQKALEYNPESVALLKAHVLAAIPSGLGDYANYSLEKLHALLSPGEYATFRTLYDVRRAAQATAGGPWN